MPAINSLDELVTKATSLVALATQNNLTIATAESCTGGLVAHCLTEVPGASQVFVSGWVCYSDEAKSQELAVPVSVLEAHGAVSEQVARHLAEGARRRAGTHRGLATTGIAGPSGARPGKPVGLMWCAVATPDQTYTRKVLVEGEQRGATKRTFAMHALELLLESFTTTP